jgi:hypothetical protein
MKRTLRRLNPGGFCVVASYTVIVIAVLAITALTTKPSNVGYDWIPFMLLSAPWFFWNPLMLWPGLVFNAFLLYMLGALLHTGFRRATAEK